MTSRLTQYLDKKFGLTAGNTSVKTEVLAGTSTFFTMCYIVALNPNILTGFQTGTELWNAIFLATCLSAVTGTLFMAFLANKPLVVASGMGMNTFFASIVANIAIITGLNYDQSYRIALCFILFEGLFFLITSLAGIRHKIANDIPPCIKLAIGPAIGLMLINIGFGSNVSIYAEGNQYTTPFYVMRDFFGAMTASYLKYSMGHEYTKMVISILTIFTGLFTIVHYHRKNNRACVIIGLLLSSVMYWTMDYFILNENPFAATRGTSFLPSFSNLYRQTFLSFDFQGFINLGAYTAVVVLVTFCIIDMFGTIGSIIGTASKTGLVNERGDIPGIKEALTSDAVATVTAACTGTSTNVTFAESASGIQAGGRTGLTAFTCAVLLFLCIFLSPVISVIPAPATSAALIYIGIVMMQELNKIDFRDIEQITPAFVMLVAIFSSGSVGNGIGVALICYTVIKMINFKFREVSTLTYCVSALFSVKFFLVF